MASIDALAGLMDNANSETLRILREYGNPEDLEKLDKLRGDALAPSIYQPAATAIYQSVMIATLAKAFEEHVKPKPGGRPEGS